jgi:hypothetical protein
VHCSVLQLWHRHVRSSAAEVSTLNSHPSNEGPQHSPLDAPSKLSQYSRVHLLVYCGTTCKAFPNQYPSTIQLRCCSRAISLRFKEIMCQSPALLPKLNAFHYVTNHMVRWQLHPGMLKGGYAMGTPTPTPSPHVKGCTSCSFLPCL